MRSAKIWLWIVNWLNNSSNNSHHNNIHHPPAHPARTTLKPAQIQRSRRSIRCHRISARSAIIRWLSDRIYTMQLVSRTKMLTKIRQTRFQINWSHCIKSETMPISQVAWWAANICWALALVRVKIKDNCTFKVIGINISWTVSTTIDRFLFYSTAAMTNIQTIPIPFLGINNSKIFSFHSIFMGFSFKKKIHLLGNVYVIISN